MTEEEKNNLKSEVYRFGDCELDADRRELKKAGETVTLQPKAFEFLLYLIRNRARAVDKDELQDALWPRSIVTETALTRVVMKARRAVGDDADRQNVIRTVHGHGYRFVAEMQVAAEAPDAGPSPAPPAVAAATSPPLPRAIVATLAIAALIAVGWWYFSPPAFSGTVRLAVLPVDNATGDADLDWVETGFMALMNRMLEDRGVEVVGGRSVSRLVDTQPHNELLDRNSEFQATLKKTTAFTHLLASRLEHENGLYRLTYTLLHDGARPQRRTIVDQEPTALIAQAIDTVSAIVEGGAPSLGNTRVVSGDNFLNEAFARGMSLEYEGRFDEARQLFNIVIEQDPTLFWPRYEYALCTRNLREYDEAEAMFLELLGELDDGGASYERVSVNNALGVMYNSRRRNDDAKAILNDALRIATEIDRPALETIVRINLAIHARNIGDTALAYEELTAAADVYRQLDISSLPGALLNNLSGVLIGMGRLDDAQQYSLEAVDSFRLTGERLSESYALSRLSDVQQRLGLLDEAEQTANSSMAIREELGDRRGVAISLFYLSRISRERGNLSRARSYGEEIREIATEIDDDDLDMAGLQQIAYADLLAGRARDAAAGFAAATEIAERMGDRSNALESRAGVVKALAAAGDYDDALALVDELLAAASSNGVESERADALNLLANVHIARQDWSAAKAHLAEAHDIALHAENTETLATADELLGEVYLETGDIESAREHIQQAADARPNSASITILRARLAAADGDMSAALRIMSDARSRAGESWTPTNAEMLESFRVANASSQSKPGT